MLLEKIRDLFSKYPKVINGISNIKFSEYCDEYKCALVFAVPYTEMMDIKNYNQKIFQQGIDDAQEVINHIIIELKEIFEYEKIKYYVPPTAQKNEEELLAPFSFKFAAVNAGLGWIGKNDVLITDQYGPRQRLSAVLIDYDLPAGDPVKKSRCPDKCYLCANTCPYMALKGVMWNINSKREDLIDYHLCNYGRSKSIRRTGRKNACGLCMVSCPIGITNNLKL